MAAADAAAPAPTQPSVSPSLQVAASPLQPPPSAGGSSSCRAAAAAAATGTGTVAANNNNNNANNANNAASHMSFRRQRASRACETCHARKVRCDAASLGVPCTNCVAFQIECRIPHAKRKKTHGASNAAQSRDSDSERGDAEDQSPAPATAPVSVPVSLPVPVAAAAPTSAGPFGGSRPPPPAVYHTSEGTPSSTVTEAQAKKDEVDSHTYMNLIMKPNITRAPITEAGRVAFLGESSNLTLLVHDRQGSTDVVHYPLPENVRGARARLTELDNVEIDILHQRGAFLLPPRSLCDELIDAYFHWVHPIVPVINKAKFMRLYKDPEKPPSLLLLQAILLAGSRVCSNPQLMDADGSTTPAALTFYKRAKALYDANYEDDRVTIVQSLLLMGWYWEGPEDVTKNVFYWSRVATIVAQGSGMHRSVEKSQLSKPDKRLWKRIWWTLFTRDRSVAVALGRPVHINLDDSDVEMLTEDDFVEDEPDQPSEYAPDPVHVQFFLQYVKLCEIMGLVLSQQYSVAAKGRGKNPIDLTHSDMALADWLQNCPKIIYWEMPRHHFWSALLHSNYYTTLCLLHRAHMPPSGGGGGGGGGGHGHHPMRYPEDSAYPSRNIAFQAAAMITSIMENLAAHNQLRYCPAFIVYSLFSALIMHVYQMRSPVPSIQQVIQDRIRTCMLALKEVSRVWLVGKMVYTLFESILGNKVLEERLQKAAGKRHRRMQQALDQQLGQQQQQQQQRGGLAEGGKRKYDEMAAMRKYDDMAIDFSVNTPQPQESYERSRPQTPSMAAAAAVRCPTPGTMARPVASPSSGAPRMVDTFMGGGGGGAGPASGPHTRPPTPSFHPTGGFSMPATPPDLYLVTRNSPNLSQAVWENFQPDMLFPESASLLPSQSMSPTQTHGMDPNSILGQPPPGVAGLFGGGGGGGGVPSTPGMKRGSSIGLAGSPPMQAHNLHPGLVPPGNNHNNNHNNNTLGWPTTGFEAGGVLDGHSPADSWSNGSVQGLPVPSTLNVEDWFQFFGIQGDMNGLNLDLPIS